MSFKDTGKSGWRTRLWNRPETEIVASVERRARVQGVEVCRGPWGHKCEVCGQTVTRRHPLHRNDRPDRAGLTLVRE